MTNGTIALQPFQVTVLDPSNERKYRLIPVQIPVEWDEDIQDWLMTEPGNLLVEHIKLLARLRRINGQVTIKDGIATLESGTTIDLNL